MNVLMISLDRALIGGESLGDALRRHKNYGSFVDHLDIIVPSVRKDNLSIFKISENTYGHPSNSLFKIFFIFDALTLALKINKKRKIDLVVCQEPFITGFTGLIIKKIINAKLLVHFHGDFWGNKKWLKENFLNYIFYLVSRFVVPRADAIRVVSMGIKEKIIRTGINQNKIYLIPTPVDLKKFENFNQDKVNKIKERFKNKKIILYVGRLAKEKNLKMLVNSFALVQKSFSDCILLLVGDGTEKENLKKEISKLNLEEKIILEGSIKNDELSNYYQASDIFVLSSDSESFGKVLVEAGVSGLPAVVTKTTGAKEIIKDNETGLLVKIGNKDDFAQKILYLLQNPDICVKMGKQAKLRINNNFGDTTKEIIKLWKKI